MFGDRPNLRSILKPTTKERETPEPVLGEPYPIEHIRRVTPSLLLIISVIMMILLLLLLDPQYGFQYK